MTTADNVLSPDELIPTPDVTDTDHRIKRLLDGTTYLLGDDDAYELLALGIRADGHSYAEHAALLRLADYLDNREYVSRCGFGLPQRDHWYRNQVLDSYRPPLDPTP